MIIRSCSDLWGQASLSRNRGGQLLKINELCYQLSFMGLCSIEKYHTYTLQEFKAAQIVRVGEVRKLSIIFKSFPPFLILWCHQ